MVVASNWIAYSPCSLFCIICKEWCNAKHVCLRSAYLKACGCHMVIFFNYMPTLIGVWLGEDQGTKFNTNTHVHKRLDRVFVIYELIHT